MTELAIVVFVTLLVFGATKIPALGDALGRAVRNVRQGGGDRDAGAPGDAEQPPPKRRSSRGGDHLV
jgi:sec-independent protein translocase protein TatA